MPKKEFTVTFTAIYQSQLERLCVIAMVGFFFFFCNHFTWERARNGKAEVFFLGCEKKKKENTAKVTLRACAQRTTKGFEFLKGLLGRCRGCTLLRSLPGQSHS